MRAIDRGREREYVGKGNRVREKGRDREKDSETGRETDKETDLETERESEREREKTRERECAFETTSVPLFGGTVGRARWGLGVGRRTSCEVSGGGATASCAPSAACAAAAGAS